MNTLKSLEWKTVKNIAIKVKVVLSDERHYLVQIIKQNGDYYCDIMNDWYETLDIKCAKTPLQTIKLLGDFWQCDFKALVDVALDIEHINEE